jgi:hypothetical protein
MKAISLWEPYASLFAAGLKQLETRSKPLATTVVDQQIAIHAAQRWQREGQFLVALRQPFVEALSGLWWESPSEAPLIGSSKMWRPPTLGKIIAVATFVGSIPTTANDKELRFNPLLKTLLKKMVHGGMWEAAFGDFGHGRHAWIAEERHRLKEPIEASGGQYIWTVPPKIELQVQEKLHEQRRS